MGLRNSGPCFALQCVRSKFKLRRQKFTDGAVEHNRALGLLRSLLKFSPQPFRNTGQSIPHSAGPLDIFKPALDRPVRRRRAGGEGSYVTRLVRQCENLCAR